MKTPITPETIAAAYILRIRNSRKQAFALALFRQWQQTGELSPWPKVAELGPMGQQAVAWQLRDILQKEA